MGVSDAYSTSFSSALYVNFISSSLLTCHFQAAAKVQEAFSAEYYPSIWRVIPLYEDFISKWKEFANNPTMIELWPAIKARIESLKKYYNKTDGSPIHIV